MKIVMICLGNICRSPIAEGVMKKLIRQHQLDWEVYSAGTSGFHNGEKPHTESISVSAKHEIDITHQRSQQVDKSDIETADLLVVMDQQNHQNVLKLCSTKEQKAKVKLLLNYSYPGENRAVPDPYYEGGFDRVFDMIYQACEDLIDKERTSIK